MENIKELKKSECFKILKNYLKDMKKTDKKKNQLIEHSQRVTKICKRISKELGYNCCDKKLLYRAAILHDIAKFHNKKEHHNKAEKILSGNYRIENKMLFEIIQAHKGDFNPSVEVVIEAGILRIADKVDKINKFQEDANSKYYESLAKIANFYERNNLEDFELFEEACYRVKKNVEKNL